MLTDNKGISNIHVTTGEHNINYMRGEMNAFSFESIRVAEVNVVIYFQDV